MPSRRPGSITRRLIIASLCTFPLLLILTGIAIDRAYTTSLLNAEQQRLKLQFFGLLGAMEWQRDNLNMSERLREPRFSQFRSGLYAQITNQQGKILWRSLSAETLELPIAQTPPAPGKEIISDVAVNRQPYFLFQYLAIWEDDNEKEIPLLFSIYLHKAPYLGELRQFRQQLALWLGLVLVLAIGISIAILYWGLRPLRNLANDLSRLERGEQLELSHQYPRELTGVTSNLNQLLQKEKKQRERYRNTLADLAHSLKTPLAVLRAEELDKSAQREQLSRMENIVAYQLQRAVSSGHQPLMAKTPLQPLLEKLLNSLEKVYRGKNIQFHTDLPMPCQLAMDEQDCLELLGNLLDNASKACHDTIIITGRQQDTTYELCIDDDGPGINEDQRQYLLNRGQRGDQYGAGQGLGLAIASDIVSSYEAELHFETAPELGGTRVRLRLPC